jgi:hypothetical protein
MLRRRNLTAKVWNLAWQQFNGQETCFGKMIVGATADEETGGSKTHFN